MTATGDGPGLGDRIGNEFSGRASAVVQTGRVAGDIILHAPTESDLPTPRQLPPAARHFVNRESDVRRLDDYLQHHLAKAATNTGAVVVSAVSGAAGIGKPAPGL